MKSFHALFLAGLLLLLSSTASLAMISFSYVDPKKASEMGMKLEARRAGSDGVWIELSFDTKGKLKDYSPEKRYSRVELRIDGTGKGKNDQTRLVTAGLEESRPKPDRVAVSLSAERSQLERFEIWVIIGGGLLDGGAYVLKLEEFVDLDSLDKPKKAGANSKPAAGAPPAAAAEPKSDN